MNINVIRSFVTKYEILTSYHLWSKSQKRGKSNNYKSLRELHNYNAYVAC